MLEPFLGLFFQYGISNIGLLQLIDLRQTKVIMQGKLIVVAYTLRTY